MSTRSRKLKSLSGIILTTAFGGALSLGLLNKPLPKAINSMAAGSEYIFSNGIHTKMTNGDYLRPKLVYLFETQQQAIYLRVYFTEVTSSGTELNQGALYETSYFYTNVSIENDPNTSGGDWQFKGWCAEDGDAEEEFTVEINYAEVKQFGEGWNYDDYRNQLVYFSTTYPSDDYKLVTITQTEAEIVLDYQSENDFRSITVEGSYNSDNYTVEGNVYLNEDPDSTPVLINQDNAEFIDETASPWGDGWNYDDQERGLFYYDETNPDDDFELTHITWLQVSQEIHITFTPYNSTNPDSTTHVAVLDCSNTLNPYSNNYVRGQMTIQGALTQVEVECLDYSGMEVEVVYVEQWEEDSDCVVWRDQYENVHAPNSLEVNSATFNDNEGTGNDILTVSYTDGSVTCPDIDFKVTEGPTDDDVFYYFTCLCPALGLNELDFNIQIPLNDLRTEIQYPTGWHYVREESSFFYFIDNVRQSTSLETVAFYYFGQSSIYNYGVITYIADNQGLKQTIQLVGNRFESQAQGGSEYIDPALCTYYQDAGNYSIYGYLYVDGVATEESYSVTIPGTAFDGPTEVPHWEYSEGRSTLVYYEEVDSPDPTIGTVGYTIKNTYNVGSGTTDVGINYTADNAPPIYIQVIDATITENSDSITVSGMWYDDVEGYDIPIGFSVSLVIPSFTQINIFDVGLNYAKYESTEELVWMTAEGIPITADILGVVYDPNGSSPSAEVSYSVTNNGSLIDSGTIPLTGARLTEPEDGEDLFRVTGVWANHFGDQVLTFYTANVSELDELTYSIEIRQDSSTGDYVFVCLDNEGGTHSYSQSVMFYQMPDSSQSRCEISFYVPDAKRSFDIVLTSACLKTNQSDEYFIYGYYADKQQTIEEENAIRLNSTPEIVVCGWSYSNGELVYTDSTGISWEEPTPKSAGFDKSSMEATIYFSFSTDFGEEEAVLNLTGASYLPVSDSYQISGTSDYSDDELVFTVSNVTFTGEEQQPQEEDLKPGWRYDQPSIYWFDPEGNTYGSSDDGTAIYSTKNNTISLVIDIYQNVEGEDEGVLLETQYISITFVEIISEPQTADDPYVFKGYCNMIEGGITVEIEIKDFMYEVTPSEESQEEKITEEQEAQIRTYLPEEQNERVEESIKEITSGTAAQIYSAVSDAKTLIDNQKQEGTMADDVYQEKLETIQTVTEASVVVGAAQVGASDEGKAIDNALPADTGLGQNMEDTLNEFYQTQMNYLLGKEKAPEKRSILRNNEQSQAEKILSVSKEDYAKMINFVDKSVSNMKSAALKIRKCSSASMKLVVKDYISAVKISSFREFNKEKADDDYVRDITKAIMLNMQQQVIEALKRDHKPSNNAERERQYQEQLAACEDYDTFVEIVHEVLRLKYVSLTGSEIEIDKFEELYKGIFRSWALDDPSINPTNITLEELTQATIETTTSRASKMTFRADISTQESTFLIVLGSTLGAACVGGLVVSIVLKKKRRGLAK